MRGAPQRGLARLIFRIRFRTSGDTHGRPSRWRLFQFQYSRNPWRCQAMTVSGLTRSSAERQSRSTIAKARPTGHGQPNGDAAYAHGSNVARPEADAGAQESLLAEQRELGNSLAERRVRSAWSGKATGRDSVNATISMGMDFLVGTPLMRHTFNSIIRFLLRLGFAICLKTNVDKWRARTTMSHGMIPLKWQRSSK